MSPVEFEDSGIGEPEKIKSILYTRLEPSSKEPALITVLRKFHIVKSATQAIILLLSAVTIILLAASLIIVKSVRGYIVRPRYTEPIISPADIELQNAFKRKSQSQ